MRHHRAGKKLGRDASHRKALYANLAGSLIEHGRIKTTEAKAKAVKPFAEQMITLGKRGDAHAKRQAGAYLMTGESVERLFDKVAPRFGDRQGGYLRIVHTGWRQGDGGQKVFIELLGAEKVLDEKREKRAEARAKRIEAAKAEMEAQGEGAPETAEEKK